MSQTSIDTTGQAAQLMIPGTIADLGPKKIDSAYNSEASAEIAFGLGVRRNTADDSIRLLTTGLAVADFAGIVVHSQIMFRPDALGSVGVKPMKTCGLLRFGCIWVVTEDAVTLASAVFLRIGGASPIGGFRGTAATPGTDSVDISTVAKWLSSAGAGGVAKLEINLIGA